MTATIVADRATVAAHATRLGREIAADHPDGVVLVGVLKGALIFLADLARAVPEVPVEVDFLSISRFAPDSGRVKILQDLQSDVTGRDVVIVEDIVDTGLTLAFLERHVRDRGPRRVSTCALLDRPGRRIVPQRVDYRGAVLEDEYVLGCGLHHRDLYRNLPIVVRAERAVLAERPDAYVAQLYAGAPARDEPDGTDGRVPAVEEVP